MPKTHFTNATIEKLSPGDWTDPRYPNLHMRVGKKARTWMMRLPKRADGSKPGLRLGRFPDLNKEAAVKKYESERGRLARGEPHPDHQERIRELESELRALKRAEGELVTFGELAREFMESYVPKSKRPLAETTRTCYESMLRKHLIPQWGKQDVAMIGESEVEAFLKEVKVESPGIANTLLRFMKTIFNWGIRKKKVETNPCVFVDQPSAVNPKSRHLLPDEIICVWDAFSGLETAHADALKLLLLTGQRRREVSELSWEEIDEDWWTLPAERAKNRRANLIYLSTLSRQLLEKMKARPPASTYVFRGYLVKDQPISAAHVTMLCKEVSSRLLSEGKIRDRFTPHDLRRTLTTRCREHGASRRMVQTILNHRSRSVTDIYDLYEMKPEIQKTLSDWNDFLVDLLKLKPGEV